MSRQFRAALVADLDGLVVEIGAGTGFMLPHYPRDIRVAATELDLAALRRAAERARLAPARIILVAADAGSLPFPPATFVRLRADRPVMYASHYPRHPHRGRSG